MLNRVLLVLDVLLVLASGALGVHLYRVWTPAPASATPAPPAAAGAAPAAPSAAPKAPPNPLSTYAVVAERNLFSPTRNEAPAETPKVPTVAQTPPAPPAPKPRLYGVVIGPDGGSRAYLEDPRTRKVFGYAVGDSVADSRLEQIRNDRVVLRRGSEVFEVMLRDPSKPKPTAAPQVPIRGIPGATRGVPVPGAVPEVEEEPVVPTPMVPGAMVPGQPYDPSTGVPLQPGFPGMPGQPFFPPGSTIPSMPPESPMVGPRRPPVRTPGSVPGNPTIPQGRSYPQGAGRP